MKIFVTGIEGFVGRHLARRLLSSGHEVSGTVWNEDELSPLKEQLPPLTLFQVDIRDHDVLMKAIDSASPDAIVHLAAQSSGAYSFRNPRMTFEVNVMGTLNLLEATRDRVPGARVVLVCSSDVYGKVDDDQIPIREETPFRPLNPYSASKAAQDLMGAQYCHSHGMNIVRARSFPHTGPGQNSIFALSNFARQISSIESGSSSGPVRVGNLEVIREYLDVEDVGRAYSLLIEKGKTGEVYNIASGVGHSLKELLDMMVAQSRANIGVEEDPELFRPSDIPVLIGDSTRFRRLTGWKPTISVPETLRRLLDYWRGREFSGP